MGLAEVGDTGSNYGLDGDRGVPHLGRVRNFMLHSRDDTGVYLGEVCVGLLSGGRWEGLVVTWSRGGRRECTFMSGKGCMCRSLRERVYLFGYVGVLCMCRRRRVRLKFYEKRGTGAVLWTNEKCTPSPTRRGFLSVTLRGAACRRGRFAGEGREGVYERTSRGLRQSTVGVSRRHMGTSIV